MEAKQRNSTGEDGRRPIVIAGAMDCEVVHLIGAMEEREETERYDYRVVHGRVNSYPMTVAQTRVGMVNAAILTSLICREELPLCVICQGTAGAHLPSLRPGDIVLGERVCPIHFLQTPLRGVGEGSHPEEWDFGRYELFDGAEWHEGNSLGGDRALLTLADRVPYAYGNVYHGTVGSGDVWNREVDRIGQLREHFGSLCEDMESFAVAQSCARFRVPHLCVRVISNNELTGDAFDPVTAVYGQKFVLSLVKKIIAEKAADK